VSKSLGGTTIYFGGIAAPVVYAWATQVAAVVPYGLTGTSAPVVVQYQNQASTPTIVQVTASSPGLFTTNYTGQGQAVAANNDWTLNGPGNPAKAGSTIDFFITGAGAMTPAQADGTIGGAPASSVALPVSVTIAGQTVNAIATQVAGSVAGVIVVGAQIPSSVAASNAAPVTVQVGTPSSQLGVTIAVAK